MARAKHVPERSCFACGRRAPKPELVRVVRTVDGTITIDPSGKLPGRGTYLCPHHACWEKGLNKTRLDHVLRCTVSRDAKNALLAYSEEAFQGSLQGASS